MSGKDFLKKDFLKCPQCGRWGTMSDMLDYGGGLCADCSKENQWEEAEKITMAVRFQDVVTAINNLLQYDWIDELGDFERQLTENDGVVRGHIFLDLFTLHNAARAIEGEDSELLSDIVFKQEGDEDVTVFQCEACTTVCLSPEPLAALILEDFAPGDVIPAGCCPVCQCSVYPV